MGNLEELFDSESPDIDSAHQGHILIEEGIDFCNCCDAIDDYHHDPPVGMVDGKHRCLECYRDELMQQTLLPVRESTIVAAKQLTDASNAEIAELLQVEKSTIDEDSRRIKKKLERAERTIEMVEGLE